MYIALKATDSTHLNSRKSILFICGIKPGRLWVYFTLSKLFACWKVDEHSKTSFSVTLVILVNIGQNNLIMNKLDTHFCPRGWSCRACCECKCRKEIDWSRKWMLRWCYFHWTPSAQLYRRPNRAGSLSLWPPRASSCIAGRPPVGRRPACWMDQAYVTRSSKLFCRQSPDLWPPRIWAVWSYHIISYRSP